MRRPLVGLVGLAGSGKDVAAAGLIAKGWVRRGFADPLKAMALAIDPIIVATIGDKGDLFPHKGSLYLSSIVEEHGWDEAKGIPEVRRFLQRLGTDGVRNHIGRSTWVDLLDRAWQAAGCQPTVVPDVRFRNEDLFIKRAGGMVVRIERPGIEPVADHVSESGQRDVREDITILNDGTPEQLQDRLVSAATEWVQIGAWLGRDLDEWRQPR